MVLKKMYRVYLFDEYKLSITVQTGDLLVSDFYVTHTHTQRFYVHA